MGPEGSRGDQIHDFNPGIAPSGLFWTVRLPDDSVDAHPGAGRASMEATNLPLEDDLTIERALFGTEPPIPTHASFDVRWTGVEDRDRLRNREDDFSLDLLVETSATIEWSASHDDGSFSFVSGPAEASETVFALLARERNGAFFR